VICPSSKSIVVFHGKYKTLNRPGMSGDFVGKDGVMSANSSRRYPPELRERAVRMVAEVRSEHETEWAAMRAVAELLGVGSTETVRKWVRQSEVDAGSRPGTTQSPTSNPAAELVPRSLAWRITVGSLAYRFFALIHDPETAQLINQPQDAGQAGAWPVAYLNLYLQKVGMPSDAWELGQILDAMARAGLLLPAGWRADMVGWPMQGQLYISQGSRSPQMKGNLWLSRVLGADLVIQSYNAVTVQISGGEGRPSGTGLVLDRSHIVTNRHVVEELVGHSIGTAQIEIHPSFKPPGAQWVSRQSVVRAHMEVDVAVIEAQVGDNEGFRPLPGMVFRDPRWDDEVRVFGYPYVLGTIEQPITVERGDVVNPAAEAPAVGGYPRHKIFLTSAIERPGNSGGPIVAQDGRVIGLVIDHTRAGLSQAGTGSAASSESPPFYRGIPAGEVVRAIEALGFKELAVHEDSR
jgi:transposase-like protein/S1-C subfamily serine protease